MTKILLKIHEEYMVDFEIENRNMEIVLHPKMKNIKSAKPVKKKLRIAVVDFVYDDMQYIRAGNIYIEISPMGDIREISKSKYYDVRQKANSHAKQ